MKSPRLFRAAYVRPHDSTPVWIYARASSPVRAIKKIKMEVARRFSGKALRCRKIEEVKQ